MKLTLKELADIGAAAANNCNKCIYLTVATHASSWKIDRPAREAFAKAVRDAVLANLVTKSDSLPDPYVELKAAKKAGKAIEMFIPDDEYGPDRWSLQENDIWAGGPDRYRIKPEPEPVLVPLDIDDIRATDEFRKTTSAVCVATIWTSEFIWLSGTAALKYSTLATTYERRQHGSSEWKPCTKETK